MTRHSQEQDSDMDHKHCDSQELDSTGSTYQQFHDVFFVRGSIQAFKCNFDTGHIELRMFGDSNEPLKTQVPVKDVQSAIQTLSEGRNYKVSTQSPPPQEEKKVENNAGLQLYEVGDPVVAKDSGGKWHRGTIKQLEKPDFYTVAFTGWSSFYDNVQHASFIRRMFTQPKALKDFSIGTKVIYCDNTYEAGSQCYQGVVSCSDDCVERTRRYSVVALV
jgi:hypothetical protein